MHPSRSEAQENSSSAAAATVAGTVALSSSLPPIPIPSPLSPFSRSPRVGASGRESPSIFATSVSPGSSSSANLGSVRSASPVPPPVLPPLALSGRSFSSEPKPVAAASAASLSQQHNHRADSPRLLSNASPSVKPQLVLSRAPTPPPLPPSGVPAPAQRSPQIARRLHLIPTSASNSNSPLQTASSPSALKSSSSMSSSKDVPNSFVLDANLSEADIRAAFTSMTPEQQLEVLLQQVRRLREATTPSSSSSSSASAALAAGAGSVNDAASYSTSGDALTFPTPSTGVSFGSRTGPRLSIVVGGSSDGLSSHETSSSSSSSSASSSAASSGLVRQPPFPVPFSPEASSMMRVLSQVTMEDASRLGKHRPSFVQTLDSSAAVTRLQSELIATAVRAERKANALLSLSKISNANLSIHDTIEGIVHLAYNVLNADRVSLFFVDNNYLFQAVSRDSFRWRFEVGRGIAGTVAATGIAVNVPDAYDTKEFDRSFDKESKYRTKSVLCMPVMDISPAAITNMPSTTKSGSLPSGNSGSSSGSSSSSSGNSSGNISTAAAKGGKQLMPASWSRGSFIAATGGLNANHYTQFTRGPESGVGARTITDDTPSSPIAANHNGENADGSSGDVSASSSAPQLPAGRRNVLAVIQAINKKRLRTVGDEYLSQRRARERQERAREGLVDMSSDDAASDVKEDEIVPFTDEDAELLQAICDQLVQTIRKCLTEAIYENLDQDDEEAASLLQVYSNAAAAPNSSLKPHAGGATGPMSARHSRQASVISNFSSSSLTEAAIAAANAAHAIANSDGGFDVGAGAGAAGVGAGVGADAVTTTRPSPSASETGILLPSPEAYQGSFGALARTSNLNPLLFASPTASSMAAVPGNVVVAGAGGAEGSGLNESFVDPQAASELFQMGPVADLPNLSNAQFKVKRRGHVRMRSDSYLHGSFGLSNVSDRLDRARSVRRPFDDNEGTVPESGYSQAPSTTGTPSIVDNAFVDAAVAVVDAANASAAASNAVATPGKRSSGFISPLAALNEEANALTAAGSAAEDASSTTVPPSALEAPGSALTAQVVSSLPAASASASVSGAGVGAGASAGVSTPVRSPSLPPIVMTATPRGVFSRPSSIVDYDGMRISQISDISPSEAGSEWGRNAQAEALDIRVTGAVDLPAMQALARRHTLVTKSSGATGAGKSSGGSSSGNTAEESMYVSQVSMSSLPLPRGSVGSAPGDGIEDEDFNARDSYRELVLGIIAPPLERFSSLVMSPDRQGSMSGVFGFAPGTPGVMLRTSSTQNTSMMRRARSSSASQRSGSGSTPSNGSSGGEGLSGSPSAESALASTGELTARTAGSITTSSGPRNAGNWLTDVNAVMSAAAASSGEEKDREREREREQLESHAYAAHFGAMRKRFKWPDTPNVISLADLRAADFNIFDYTEDELTVGLYASLRELGLLVEANCDDRTLQNFVLGVRKNYRDNPFHNFQHGFNVFQFAYYMIFQSGLISVLDASTPVDVSSLLPSLVAKPTPVSTGFRASIAAVLNLGGSSSSSTSSSTPNEVQYKGVTRLEILALLIASLCHDLDHPGNTNSFEVNTSSALALLHNDQSVLENHHATITFALLRNPKLNIFGNLPMDQSRNIRKVIISSILATDMTMHIDTQTKLSGLDVPPVNLTVEKDKLFLFHVIIHTADLSGQVYPQPISGEWESRISAEFRYQAEMEEKLGLPVLPLMRNLEQPHVRAQGQVNFIDFILAPWWRNLVRLYPAMNECEQRLKENRAFYVSKAAVTDRTNVDKA